MDNKSPATSTPKSSDRRVTDTQLDSLRRWNAIYIDKNCEGITGVHENELFYGCTFKKLNGLTLKDCDLNNSKFLTEDLRDALDFTLTLNCHSASNVEYSELLFNLILVLLYKTKGNDEKREKLLDVIGRDQAKKLLRILAFYE